jgi:hypothetical protein
MLSEAKLRKMAHEHWDTYGKDTSDTGMGLEFVERVLEEIRRTEGIRKRREMCQDSGGHTIRTPLGPAAAFGQIESSASDFTIYAWKASELKCTTCDAKLIITYEEEL